jgi:hypothetical protein
MRKAPRSVGLVMLVAVVLAQVLSSQGQTREPLKNEDVIKMVRAQLSTDIILVTIESANVDFDLSPNGLVAMKEAGVADRIIEEMQARARAHL